MMAERKARCVVSVAEHAGWAHLLGVSTAGDVPVVVDRRRVTLIDAGVPNQPYHHETLGMPEDQADALIARVRESVATHTGRALTGVVTDLARTQLVIALAIRKPPFPRLPATVAEVRESYRLQCSADGMLYQLAICRAAADLGLEVDLYDRGDEATQAAERIGVSVDDLEAFVNGAGRPSGPPWTIDHRRAYAAGIASLAMRTGGRAGIRLTRRA
jgi:hypothetical protein